MRDGARGEKRVRRKKPICRTGGSLWARTRVFCPHQASGRLYTGDALASAQAPGWAVHRHKRPRRRRPPRSARSRPETRSEAPRSRLPRDGDGPAQRFGYRCAQPPAFNACEAPTALARDATTHALRMDIRTLLRQGDEQDGRGGKRRCMRLAALARTPDKRRPRSRGERI